MRQVLRLLSGRMKTTEDKIKLVSNLITVSGIFCIAVSLLLLINFIHVKSSKPLESKALVALVEQFRGDSQNEDLKNDIRNLDLLARKAFFTGNWQIRTGSFLLLFGGILFAGLLRIYHDMKAKIGAPLITGGTTQITRLLSQRWILIAGGLLLGSAMVASFLTTDYLKMYRETGRVAQVTQAPEVRTVEVETGDQETKRPGDQETRDQETRDQETKGPGEQRQEAGGVVSKDSIFTPPVARLQSSSARHPSFRGHWAQGISEAVNLPVDWDGPSGRNIKWKVALEKPGYNSPVIWNNRLFIAGADAQSRIIFCYDRNTGSLLWRHEASGIPGSPAVPPRVSSDTGLAAPSVATDGKRVFAIFATGDLVATDIDGNRLWAKNLGVPNNHYGHSSSLLVWQDRLIVQFDTNSSGRLMALNVNTGEPVWDHPRKTTVSWASPMLAELDGRLQIITVTSPTVYGNDFENGSELWSLECLAGEVGASAAVFDGLVYAANEYARLVAIRPGPAPEIVWESDEYLPEAASPVAGSGLLFIATSYGMFVCYDAKTGEKYWEEEYGQGFYGSPMIAEGKVYLMDRGGTMHIFSLNRTKSNLGNPVLGEKSVVTPAFADGAIYLKGEKSLFCVAQN